MTKHDLKELAAMGAELGAAKAENERLRGLLREVRVLLANSSYKISGTAAFLSSIDNALSQQAEPVRSPRTEDTASMDSNSEQEQFTAVDMATAAALGFRDGQAAVEKSAAKDEREAFEAWAKLNHFGTQKPFANSNNYESGYTNFCWKAWQARASRPAQTEQQPAEGIHSNPYPAKCPVTGLPYFMHLEHPELGVIPTFGGPYDSYSIPYAEGSPDEPWHRRELVSHRYCHDRGHWVHDEFIPLRIIHEDVLSELKDNAAPIAQTEQQHTLWARQCDLDEPDPAIFVAREQVEESGYVVPFYAAPIAQAALSAVTAERDRLLHSQQVLMQSRNAHRDERDRLRAEVEALRKDAERYRWASSGVHEAETLVSIVNCHGGYAEKVAERVDVYREAAMAAKEA